MNTSVIEAIERQKTTNLYDASKSIPDDEIRELVRLATFSPTAFHLQNWRFIAVRSPEAKARLRAVAAPCNSNVDPEVTPNWMSHPEDTRRLLKAFKYLRQIATTEPMAGIIQEELSPGAYITSDEDLIADEAHDPEQLSPCGFVPDGGRG